MENKTITITPQIAGVVAGDKIVTAGLSAPASLPALFGVPYHHSNASAGTWLGFSRSTTPEIRANRVNGGSAGLTLPLPRLAINKIGNRVGIENTFSPKAWTHPCQQQAYEEIGQLGVHHSENCKGRISEYVFWWKQYAVAGAPITVSYSWDKTRIDFVVDEVWGRAEILPIGFYTTDGRKIFEIRGASGGVAAAEIFYMVVGMQTFVSNPAACSYIDHWLCPLDTKEKIMAAESDWQRYAPWGAAPVTMASAATLAPGPGLTVLQVILQSLRLLHL